MEEAFNKLKNDGLNGVDNIIQWMKTSKVIEDTQEAEGQTRQLFADVQDQENVQIEEFTAVVDKLAADGNTSAAELFKKLVAGASSIQEALSSAAAAFQAALK